MTGRPKVRLLSFICAVSAVACMRPVRTTVTMTASQFEKDTAFVGIDDVYEAKRYFLRSWIGVTYPVPHHQLYVKDSYQGDWRFWNRANGQDAQQLEFTEISHDVSDCHGGCWLVEQFGIALSDSLLRAHGTDGYEVKIYAQTGETAVIFVAPGQIAAQLAAIRDYRNTAPRTSKP